MHKASLGHIPRILVFALLGTTVLVLIVGAYPHHSLAARSDDLGDRVLGSPAFVVAMRIVAMYVFVFVLASVVARIWQGHWLRKAGPFEVSDEVQTIKEERDKLAREARDAKRDVERLKDTLANSDGLIRNLSQQLAALQNARTGKKLLRLPVVRRS
jgi:hypothetical protein